MNNQISVLFSGDFCPVGRNEDLFYKGDIELLFGDILPIIDQSTIAVTNLECPLVPVNAIPIEKTGPNLSAKTDAAKILKETGFDLLSLANNHIFDYGEVGIETTINACTKNSLEYMGVGKTNTESRRVFYYNQSDIKLAFLNFCENEWSTTTGNSAGASPLNPITNYYDIRTAAEDSDYVFVVLHGNNEMYNLPSPRIKELCRFYIDAGATFVICHHSHVYSGFEKYKDGMIFYGLGNLLFDNPKFCEHDWNIGMLVEISVSKDDAGFRIIPFEQSSEKPGARLLVSDSEEKFFDSVELLNSIIADNDKLSTEFDRFCKKKGIQLTYNSYMQPYSNRLMRALYKRGFIPSLLSRKKKLLLENLIRCESHRDVLGKILKK